MKYLRLKDFFTTLNLFLVFFSLILLFLGYFQIASFLIVFNMLILDLVDGFVARITKSSNEFGKHFDTITDFLGSSVLIPFFIYVAYEQINFYLALFLGFIPLFFGVLREIQSRLESIKRVGYWIGLPRIMSALLILGFLNSNFFDYEWGKIGGVFLIVLSSLLNVFHWPYLGNDKAKFKLPLRVKIYLLICISIQIGLSCIGMFWDGIAIMLFCYLIGPLVMYEKELWDDIKRQVSQQ